jgi:integrase
VADEPLTRLPLRSDTGASAGPPPCGRLGMLDVNPAKVGVDNPARRRKEQHPFESWAELETVAAAIGPRYGPMILFAAVTGLRPAEWIALEKRDIDRKERVVYVRRSFERRAQDPEDGGEHESGTAAGAGIRRARPDEQKRVDRWQRFRSWSVFGADRFDTRCNWLRPLCSTNAPSWRARILDGKEGFRSVLRC